MAKKERGYEGEKWEEAEEGEIEAGAEEGAEAETVELGRAEGAEDEVGKNRDAGIAAADQAEEKETGEEGSGTEGRILDKSEEPEAEEEAECDGRDRRFLDE